jgi:hypothetical protein
MATVKNITVSRFDNLSNEALADAIGRADAIVKAAEAELAALKDEFKARASPKSLAIVGRHRNRADIGPPRRQGVQGFGDITLDIAYRHI